jgi:hypothetical protein
MPNVKSNAQIKSLRMKSLVVIHYPFTGHCKADVHIC